MTIRLFRRRTVLFPTLFGWVCLFLSGIACVSWWWFRGESFLSLTDRRPADVLVVEGWVGMDCPQAAVGEFRRGNYRWVAVAGGLTGHRWSPQRWNSVAETQRGLVQLGIPKDQIIAAPTDDYESQRTYEMAVAARRALERAGIQPSALNVFTQGVHARRSRLVFAKVFGSATAVGVVSMAPAGYNQAPWWRSSERAEDLVKETIGYAYELLLGSGRGLNPAAPAPE